MPVRGRCSIYSGEGAGTTVWCGNLSHSEAERKRDSPLAGWPQRAGTILLFSGHSLCWDSGKLCSRKYIRPPPLQTVHVHKHAFLPGGEETWIWQPYTGRTKVNITNGSLSRSAGQLITPTQTTQNPCLLLLDDLRSLGVISHTKGAPRLSAWQVIMWVEKAIMEQ